MIRKTVCILLMAVAVCGGAGSGVFSLTGPPNKFNKAYISACSGILMTVG